MAIRVPIVDAVLPPSRRRVPGWARLLAVPATAGIVVLGVWIFGGKVTNDFALAMVLTAAWFGAAGLASLLAGLRWRALLLPVFGTFLAVSIAIGVYLADATLRDRVVNEEVVVAGPPSEATPGGPAATASGAFESRAHDTSGTATIVQLPDGGFVLTLTEFETDAGPDLRVYLVRGNGDDVSGAVDLGGLKGNRGNQQYEIPPEVDPADFGSVVIWCRAFSVNFGTAVLGPAD
jgi:hypothetical protein